VGPLNREQRKEMKEGKEGDYPGSSKSYSGEGKESDERSPWMDYLNLGKTDCETLQEMRGSGTCARGPKKGKTSQGRLLRKERGRQCLYGYLI